LIELASGARFVLLGEAMHGTHEFYRERAEITKRLIVELGFDAVAVEADWPDAYRANCWVRGASGDGSAGEALSDFERFPTWMWRNRDVEHFLDWLRDHNDSRGSDGEPVGFYGLDLYSLHASMRAVVDYLDRVDADAAARARARYACFDQVGGDPQAYAFANEPCEDEVVAQLIELRERAAELATRDGRVAEDRLFAAEQSARLVRNAERYYRSLIRGDVSSWNVRDQHMAETLDALAEHLSRAGRPARIVVWAHNSHLGDPTRHRLRPPRRAQPRPIGMRALAGRDAGRRLQHRPRHRLGRLRLGCAGRAEARAAGPRRKLRAALPHDRDPGLPDRPAGDRRARAAAITAEWEQGELPETYPSAL